MNAASRGLPVQPFDVHDPVNAGASSTATFTWLNSDQELEAPSTLRYRIDNLTDYLPIVAWTSVGSPAGGTEIAITPSQNAMSTTWRDRQLMQVTAEAVMADGTTQRKLYVYDLIAQVLP